MRWHRNQKDQLNRVDHQMAYVLMSQPWKESSLIIEVLTPYYGRFSLIARSARRPKSALRGVLMPLRHLIFPGLVKMIYERYMAQNGVMALCNLRIFFFGLVFMSTN